MQVTISEEAVEKNLNEKLQDSSTTSLGNDKVKTEEALDREKINKSIAELKKEIAELSQELAKQQTKDDEQAKEKSQMLSTEIAELKSQLEGLLKSRVTVHKG